MGCSESKIDNVRTVNQCKERTTFMKQSVSAHAAFVSAHIAYAAALKNTGVALFEYARSELQPLDDRPPTPHPTDHSRCPPLQPDGILAWDFFVMSMEDARGPSLAVAEDRHSGIEKPMMQKKVVKNPSGHGGGGVVKTANGGRGEAVESGEGPPLSSMKKDVKNVSLLKVFRELGDGFIKASESAYEVSKIHEANKLHYHSNFAGQNKHSTRVNRFTNSAKVDCSSKEKETHATLLDKMLAWEKKLYDQVKDGEMMKHEYQKKIRLLNKLRKRGVSSDRLKQTEATVKHLHTRYIVEVQSIDSTVSEINRLRDEQLYPKLVQIVEQMGEMWKNMRNQHEHQLTIVQRLINIKISQSPIDTSEHNLKNIEQIHHQATIWSSEFEKLTLHQKQYTKSLNNWLNLNLISTDHNVKPQNPKIKSLLRTWNDELEKLQEETAKTAINSFSTAIAAIVEYHSTEMEMKMKERCVAIRREIMRRTLKFEEWCDKQIRKRLPSDEMDVDVMDDMDVVAEQQAVVEVLKRRLSEEEEVYRRCRVQVKEMTVVKMKTALMEVFMAMMEFSGACSQMYESLKPR